MDGWILIAAGALVAGAVAAFAGARARTRAAADGRVRALVGGAPGTAPGTVDLDAVSGLPAPVRRYFRRVLTHGQGAIRTATLHQSGTLRTGVNAAGWHAFSARQLVVPPAVGFVWDARVAMPLATHVRVLDSYVDGVGSGRVGFLSALVVAAESGAAELNAGALHRYLAEAVWFPTALLPSAGVAWTGIDERAALATLSDHGTTVSLEFRFDDDDEVAAIYSPGRFGRFGGGYERVPWEGRFRDYHVRGGMRVPRYGEVGWYRHGALQPVWRGDLVDARYELDA